ncbi:MAG: hypothetical protein JO132_05285 [Streptosporangiaceae bacterium]|nr:hypothetical protein [Streptosporangiaceae bacterium]
MPELERDAIEVWLHLDEEGVAVRVYGPGDRLLDAYHAHAVSIQAAQAEVTARYTERGYRAEGSWRLQRWSTDRQGFGEIIHDSSRSFA